jgi:hypothetical protein
MDGKERNYSISNDDDNPDDEKFVLSEHSKSMRDAFVHCLDLFDDKIQKQIHDISSSLSSSSSSYISRDIINKAFNSSNDHQKMRTEAYDKFWSNKTTTTTTEIPHFRYNDILDKDEDESQQRSGKILQSIKFRRQFHNMNVPCLITGLDVTSFEYVNQHWITKSQNGGDDDTTDNDDNSKSMINRQWFVDHLGKDHRVPLRYHDSNTKVIIEDGPQSALLDGDGRAFECKTRHVTIKEWGDILVARDDEDDHDKHNGEKISYYLKDWHLQQEFKNRVSPATTTTTTTPFSLYACPDIFHHDMLNSFLIRFTTGDYRFCYWGPKYSTTYRHSDVLHSFSWSYNVTGTKEWTFYHQSCDDDDDDNSIYVNTNSKKQITIRQTTGQTIFVPATWQHKVVNLEESISLNHNWITTANVDLTWDCLCTEMKAIDNELRSWGNDCAMADDLEIGENMLRGCSGLDVTSFFFMVLLRMIELIGGLSRLLNNHDGSSLGNTMVLQEQLAECLFDIFQLNRVLILMQDDDNRLIQLGSRLRAVLNSDGMVVKAKAVANTLTEWVKTISER